MKDINYITDEQRKKTAVISLKNYKEEIEYFPDGLEAQSRLEEPPIDFEKAVTKIISTKSKNGKAGSYIQIN